jgi:hypothetical protein
VDDAFLFVVTGECDEAEIRSALDGYGFAGYRVLSTGVVLDEDAVQPDGSVLVPDGYDEEVGWEVERWVGKEHKGALPVCLFPGPDSESLSAYSAYEWRRIGIESTESTYDWPFDVGRLGALLPDTHYSRGEVWMEALEQAVGLADIDPFDDFGAFQAGLWAATLCEWLHGFEGASENGWNNFDAGAACDVLGLSDLLLGYECRSTEDASSTDRLDECEDLAEMRRWALLALTARERHGVVDGLRTFFGNDVALFWTLYAAIWPSYGKPLWEALEDVVGLRTVEIGEIDEAFSFVRDGWSTRADAS